MLGLAFSPLLTPCTIYHCSLKSINGDKYARPGIRPVTDTVHHIPLFSEISQTPCTIYYCSLKSVNGDKYARPGIQPVTDTLNSSD